MSDTDNPTIQANSETPSSGTPNATEVSSGTPNTPEIANLDLIDSPVIVLTDDLSTDLTTDFGRCYSEVKTWIIGDNNLNTIEAISLSLRIMKLVERTVKTSGEQKKALVIRVLKQLVIDHHYTDESDRESLNSFIDSILPLLIDSFVALARGRIDIGKKCRVFKKLACCK